MSTMAQFYTNIVITADQLGVLTMVKQAVERLEFSIGVCGR